MKNIIKAVRISFILLLAAISGAAQNTSAILETNTGCLIGGVRNKKWISDKEIFSTLKGGEQFNLFTLTGAAASPITPKIIHDEPPCEDYYGIEGMSEITRGVATTARWNALPRQPREISPTDATYLEIVGAILRARKFANPKIKIDKAYRVDLEGDGAEEVVLAATSYKSDISPYPSAGDYSFLLLRKIVGGKAQNIFLDSEFYPKGSRQQVAGRYAISAIADLNGDGKMEIIMHGGYYEGSWASVYEITGAKAKDVLTCSCGV